METQRRSFLRLKEIVLLNQKEESNVNQKKELNFVKKKLDLNYGVTVGTSAQKPTIKSTKSITPPCCLPKLIL